MPFEASSPIPRGFYRQSDFHRMRCCPMEYQRLLDLWIMVIILRVRATKPETKGGPVGKAFLVSREFARICDMLGLDYQATKKLLQPYAGNQKKFPRLAQSILNGKPEK